jgi:hypothetical protein
MQRFLSSHFKNKLQTFNKLYISQFSFGINKTSSFRFSNSNETSTEKKEDNQNRINDETIEVESLNNQKENEFKITDMYTIKSKKLGDPNIKKIIDHSKFEHNNVKLRVYNKEDYNKDPFKNSKMIPASPKLGPFEVN